MSCSIRIDRNRVTYNSEEARKVVENLLREKADAKKSIFKIGITNYPARRIGRGQGHMATRKELKVYADLGHEYGADQPWDEMYVVYEDDRYANVQALEAALINKYSWLSQSKESQPLTCWNERGGGAGRIPSKGPYYVYILFG